MHLGGSTIYVVGNNSMFGDSKQKDVSRSLYPKNDTVNYSEAVMVCVWVLVW